MNLCKNTSITKTDKYKPIKFIIKVFVTSPFSQQPVLFTYIQEESDGCKGGKNEQFLKIHFKESYSASKFSHFPYVDLPLLLKNAVLLQ